MAQDGRGQRVRLVGHDAAPGHDRQRQGRHRQPPATVLGALRAAPGQCHCLVRLRIGRQLVCPAPEVHHHRAAGVTVRDARHHGTRGAVRHRGQVRPPGPSSHRLRGRWCHADEWHGRAHHHKTVLAGVVRSSPYHCRAAQQRPESSHLGDAGPGRSTKFAASQDLPDVSYAGFAASLGLEAIEIHHADEIGPAWEKALAAGCPTVLDVYTDADVSPIPPHDTFEQMRDAAKALVGGDENAWGSAQDRHPAEGPRIPPGTKGAE